MTTCTATTVSARADWVPDWPRCFPGCMRWTSATSPNCRTRFGPRSRSTALRWSASNARPTKSRRLQPFSAVLFLPRHNNRSSQRRTTPMSLPALDDITAHRGTVDPIDDVVRIETAPREKATPISREMMRSVYPHDEVFGEFCTVNGYIDCPPDEPFDYLSDTRSLEEWTYSLRGFTPTEEPGLWLAYDRLGSETEIFTRTVASRDAMTVDYHCAWDQGKHLWMIYLMRIIDAQLVFDKPGSVVLWTNCHHPFYDKNPYPEAAPPERPVWVGDFWDMFGPGHLLELKNLKAIAEYRHHNGLSVTPDWMK